MRSDTTLSNRLLPARDSFEDCHALLHELIRLDIQQIRAGETMLGDENRLPVALDIGQEFGGLTLKGGNKFGTHKVTLQYHFTLRKPHIQRANARN